MKDAIMTAIILSELAYLDEEEIKRKLPNEMKDFHFIENKATDTQLFIVYDNATIWIVFRGTESAADWARDANCTHTVTPRGSVHSGFFAAIEGVYDEVNQVLDDFSDKEIVCKEIDEDQSPYEIVCCGHSLGAALSEQMVCALNEANAGVPLSSIAIAPPRSMSKELARSLGAIHHLKFYHVINNNDTVTRMPPRLLGYRHVDNRYLYYIDEDGEVHTSISWWRRFLDRIKGRMYDIGELGTDGVKDHNIVEYKKAWSNWIS